MTETFLKRYMTKNQQQPQQNPSVRPTKRKTYLKLLPCDSKAVPFLSITALCPLWFYQKWSHSKGIQPKLGTRSYCPCQRFRDLRQNSWQLGCLLRRPRASGHYKIRTWFMRASWCSVLQIYKYFCRDFFLYRFSFLFYNYISRSNSY